MVRKVLKHQVTLRIALIALFAVSVIWCVDSVMRESDQASVIIGSLELARDGIVSGREFYNYDKTYVSYWILASVYYISGLEQVGASADAIVATGNYVAAWIFVLGLAVSFISCGPSKWYEWIAALCVLFAPTFWFSAPLLSSNMISGGFLFLLIAVMNRRRSVINSTLTGLLAFLAVGSRADAVLVMPLMALLSSREANFKSLFLDLRLWVIGVASVSALVLGVVISDYSANNPGGYFYPSIFSGYVLFGLCGAIVVFGGFVMSLAFRCLRQPSLWGGLLVLSVLAPLIYYGQVMCTPRHLLTTSFQLLILVMFARGREHLAELAKLWQGKVAYIGAACLSLVMMFVGVSMESIKSVKPVVSGALLFPSADGHWPMGENLVFFQKIAKAAEHPIDHNQRVSVSYTHLTLPTKA